ncbi:DUF6168 family protein [Maribacter cobaltidurans]|uniref:DUF6168 family protein n=1 Tax=Maribacter cobaltidurans TaxID=1178778 RepID=UPI0013151919|nr:DUF6168 family protein [Maribacter cobaltidurans]
MLKRIVLYIIVFIFVGAISFFIHNTLLGNIDRGFHLLLEKAYVFHFFFSLVLVVAFQFLSKVKKLVAQLGFLYIATLVFKIVVFTAIFYPQLMGDQPLPHFYRAMILIPIFIFLTLEVIFVSKIIREK